MGDHELKQVNEEKDLGIVIDKDLKFRQQAAIAIKKANMHLGIIKRSFLCLDELVMPMLFKSLVRPHLEYGNIIWGPFNKEDIGKVESIQRRATKCIKKLKHMDYGLRLKTLKLPSLQHRRRRGDMIYAYKMFSNKIDLNIKDFFTMSPGNTRGHKYKVVRQGAKKMCRINNFSNRIISDWNSLPGELVECTTTDNFKRMLDAHWNNEQYNYM